jgi:DNA-binding MarR family transcriptional regulator
MDPETDLARTADALLGAVGQIRRRSRRVAGEGPLPGTSLTGAQGEVVRAVRRSPGLSITEVAAGLGTAPNTVSTLVRQLVDAGHLRREPHPDDRRVARLYLTDRARREVERWRDDRIVAVARAVELLAPADRDALTGAIEVLSRVGELIGVEDQQTRTVTADRAENEEAG